MNVSLSLTMIKTTVLLQGRLISTVRRYALHGLWWL